MRPTATQLILLQTDLGLLHPTDAQIIQLSHFLSMAATAIERAGIQLSADVPADDMLLAMYAAWLYRKRIQGWQRHADDAARRAQRPENRCSWR